VLMWQPFLDRVQQLKASGINDTEAWTQAGVDVMRRQQKRTAIPRYAEVFIREIWELQPRLLDPRARQIPSLSTHPRFRAGFDFLYLREKSGDGTTAGMGQWWHDYQELGDDQREKIIADLNRKQLRANRKRKGEKAESATSDAAALVIDNQPIQLLPVEDEKPRRRRVRKPRSAESQAESTDGRIVEADVDADSADAQLSADASSDQPKRQRSPRQQDERQLPRRRRRPRDLSTVFMGPY
jgi:poly(A) polymerase